MELLPDVEPMEQLPPTFKVPLSVMAQVDPARAVPAVRVPVLA
jgi:hypothetical protein